MSETERITNHNIDIERLVTRIEAYLQENKFEVAMSKDPTEPASWFFIQARKAGALRTAAGARRSTDITIKGTPNDFEVTIGTGEWGKNIITSAPLFIVPIVGISATLAKLYVAKRFEDNLWRYIKDQARFLKESYIVSENSLLQANQTDKREYKSEYIEGYPEWKSSTQGTLILERRKGKGNQIIFRTLSDRELTIPVESIIRADIISKKSRHSDKDLMIKISYHDSAKKDKKIEPIFNVSDDTVSGILAGIDELVGEDRLLRGF